MAESVNKKFLNKTGPFKFPLLSPNFISETEEMKKSPLEVFEFPQPPKIPFHYSVQNGENYEVYAQPNKTKNPNFNPFDQNYSILSPSR